MFLAYHQPVTKVLHFALASLITLSGYLLYQDMLKAPSPAEPIQTIYSHWELPIAIKNSNITYEHVPHVKGLSCGFNVLLNAARVEDRAGIGQSHKDLEIFKATCTPYLDKKNMKPTNGLPSKMIHELADNLALQPTSFLGKMGDEIHYFNPGKLHTDTGSGSLFISPEATEQRFEQIRQLLSGKNGEVAIAHFPCHVKYKEDHVILISVIKDAADNYAFYIRDNMNKKIEDDSDIVKYVTFIKNKLC